MKKTTVSIAGEQFHINGQPTYPGRSWTDRRGRTHRIEGLLMNSRMVQGIFDDLNPESRALWRYPDNSEWDPQRNTREFIEAMPVWREHGLLSFNINLQGGNPHGYSRAQPWHNTAFADDGSLRTDYMDRLERILDRADELGMVVQLGYFYFGQDQRFRDEQAVINATDNATDWVLEKGYRNVLIETSNECDNPKFDQEILKPPRAHELIERIQQRSAERDHRLPVSVSYCGAKLPEENVVRTADFLLLHGNGVGNPDRIAEMVRRTRALPGYTPRPILFNEDDHFDFDKPWNNFVAAVSEYASWGYFDYRLPGEGFDEGYQSVPVNWRISSQRKRGFVNLLREITGG
jgi:hypothetical protein